MPIGTDYRLFFKSEADRQTPTSLEISGGGSAEDAVVWLATPAEHGQHEFIVSMSRKEARELTALLRVLFEEATEEDDALVGVRRETAAS